MGVSKGVTGGLGLNGKHQVAKCFHRITDAMLAHSKENEMFHYTISHQDVNCLLL